MEERDGRDFGDRSSPKSYRFRLMAKLFAAERIVTYMSAHPGSRMLIFMHRRDVTGTSGVPDFVAQKVQLRQLILDEGKGSGERPRLLTLTRRGIAFGLL